MRRGSGSPTSSERSGTAPASGRSKSATTKSSGTTWKSPPPRLPRPSATAPAAGGDPSCRSTTSPSRSLANATRYFTPQLKEYETIVLTAQDTLADFEADVFRRVMGQVAGTSAARSWPPQAVAYLDVVSTLAEVAVAATTSGRNSRRPARLHIEAGRHPTLEAVIGRRRVRAERRPARCRRRPGHRSSPARTWPARAPFCGRSR